MVEAGKNLGGTWLHMVTMGKSHKPSRVLSSSLCTDYGIETMGESDGAGVQHRLRNSDSGVGSSGRFDADLTASEDSCAPKRKSMSLNMDTSEAFGLPSQVFSLSSMSRNQRKELEKKLMTDLKKVRELQRKITARCFNGVALSSSSDVRSRKCDVEKAKISVGPLVSAHGNLKPNKKDNSDLFEKVTGKPGKHRVPKNVERLKRGPSGRFEPGDAGAHKVNGLRQSVNAGANKVNYKDSSAMKQCESVLDRLMSHQYSWVFNTPVDVVKLNIPDYFHIIKHPMDLGTVKRNLAAGTYESAHAFASDVRLTFSNAKTYNPPGNDVHIMADVLSKYFETRWKVIEKRIYAKLTHVDSTKVTTPVANTEPNVTEQSPRLVGGHLSQKKQKKRKIFNRNDKSNEETGERVMSEADRTKLSQELGNLTGDAMEDVLEVLRHHAKHTNPNSEDEIEIDIDSLSNDVLFTLRKLLDEHVKKKNPVLHEKVDEIGINPVEVESCKGNDLADEDVDIGGNDPPTSGYPPIEIEKDMVPRGNKCTASSSSSGDSGSYSSDSDSASSSGSDSEGDKVAFPASAAKELTYSRPLVDHLEREKLQVKDGSRPVSKLEELEHNPHTKTTSSGSDSRHQGEDVPPERQVSPTKLYRAALLRSRFADTILKAREKTLGQSERKGDPDKLRREREELERQQREEKARIEAEAKAAENAQREADAVAAAELKKKREEEREAARLALQKMEKTVEIDENSQFLKHLEMFQSVPLPDHLPSSLDETTNLEHCGDGMVGFKLGVNNPLEQLGLYRKDDDEDEDDGLPDVGVTTTVLPATGEVEEGEID